MCCVLWSCDWAPSWSRIARITGSCPAAQIRRPAESTGGQVSALGQTTTGTNALEIDMPPSHQRDAVKEMGGDHVLNSATDPSHGPNRARFALLMSESRLWETGCMTVQTAPAELPALVPTPGRAFGIYVHVPFCATRCGYCDFNTYTPA